MKVHTTTYAHLCRVRPCVVKYAFGCKCVQHTQRVSVRVGMCTSGSVGPGTVNECVCGDVRSGCPSPRL